jgi:hypothetical protein
VKNSRVTAGKRRASRPSCIGCAIAGLLCIGVCATAIVPTKSGALVTCGPGAKAELATGASVGLPEVMSATGSTSEADAAHVGGIRYKVKARMQPSFARCAFTHFPCSHRGSTATRWFFVGFVCHRATHPRGRVHRLIELASPHSGGHSSV